MSQTWAALQYIHIQLNGQGIQKGSDMMAAQIRELHAH